MVGGIQLKKEDVLYILKMIGFIVGFYVLLLLGAKMQNVDTSDFEQPWFIVFYFVSLSFFYIISMRLQNIIDKRKKASQKQ